MAHCASHARAVCRCRALLRDHFRASLLHLWYALYAYTVELFVDAHKSPTGYNYTDFKIGVIITDFNYRVFCQIYVVYCMYCMYTVLSVLYMYIRV